MNNGFHMVANKVSEDVLKEASEFTSYAALLDWCEKREEDPFAIVFNLHPKLLERIENLVWNCLDDEISDLISDCFND